MLAGSWWKMRSRIRKAQGQMLGRSFAGGKRISAFADEDAAAADVNMRMLTCIAFSLFAVCLSILYLGTQMLHLSLWRWTRYCDSSKITGTWVDPVPEFPAYRYMYNIDESDSCSYEYIIGLERLTRKIPSDLRIEVWGDKSQLHLTSALMCWLSGRVPWQPEAALPYLPAPLNSGKTGTSFTWTDGEKCFAGAPVPDASLSEANVVNAVLEDTSLLSIPNVLVISADLLQAPRKGVQFGQDLLKDLTAFFKTLALNHDVLRRIKIIFLEPSLPPSMLSAQSRTGSAEEIEALQDRVVELAVSFGVPIIRTNHLVYSSSDVITETDEALPGLSHHRAQLVLNFVKHLRT
ncbi:Hypothetical Protein FCC1311_065652 [Hondaea fermentalgiana]|uniref:Uncharacterized protein n=1 Tax=Hondaea fermentalgiana TaxID=2315210 RepID=A0A2R5GHH1_9STRA|nr:Hypothetical Protein FCC1311_065652 [Hondaea fermentalgiana]|eukprot:GBG30346.1 Hypothetical Protein FCC1311_065652 [Hondaea fermentalgiana]